MITGLGRGAAAGAVYAVVGVIVLLASDDPSGFFDDVGAVLLVLLYVSWLAGLIGATCGCLAGALGGLLLGALAELGLSRRPLMLVGAALGCTLGWFSLDLAAAIGSAPDDDSVGEMLLWRLGPACAGALAAGWQAARTRLRPAKQPRHAVG